MTRKMLTSLVAMLGLFLPLLMASTNAQLHDPFGTTQKGVGLCINRSSTTTDSKISKFNNDISIKVSKLLGREGPQATLLEDLATLAEPGAAADFEGLAYLQEYGMTLIPYVAPAGALFVLALLVAPCFFVARCCCASRCCNSLGPFNKKQIWLPLVFYILFSTIAMGLAFASVYQLSSIIDGAVGGACEFESLVSDSSFLLDSLVFPVNNISTSVSALQIKTETRFTTQSNIVAYSQTLIIELDDLVAILNDGAEDEAEVYANIDTRVDEIQLELDSALLPLISSLDEIRVETFKALGQASTGLSLVASSAANTTNGLAAEIHNTADPILNSVKDVVGTYSDDATSVSYYFYSIVFVAFGAGVLVLITALTPTKFDKVIGYGIFSCSWTLTYMFMLLMFLLSGVLLPLSIVSSDVCAVIVDIPNNVDTWVSVTRVFNTAVEKEAQRISSQRHLQQLPQPQSSLPSQDEGILGQVSHIVKGCFASPPVPLSTSLNLTEAINLENFYAAYKAGDLPSLYNATNIITFEELVDDFSASKTTMSSSSQPTLDAAHVKLREIQTLLNEIQATVVVMHASIGDSLIAIAQVADGVRDLENVDSCEFLTQRYNNLVEEVCDGSVTAVSTLSFFGFAIAVCAIPMLITSILISNRIFHYEELPMANAFARQDYDNMPLKLDHDAIAEPAHGVAVA